MKSRSISGALFSSVQQRVLALIFGHPERSFYASEIVRRVKSGTGAVDRELARLHGSGLVTVERIGNQKHYRANRQSPIFDELHSIVLKTVGITEPLARFLQPCADKIQAAFVYGSIAKGADTARSDIDLLVIADGLSYPELFESLQKAESVLGRPVNPNVISSNDWKRKAAQDESFVARIAGQPKIFVIGSQSDLP